MKDIQAQKDKRGIQIQRAGITDLYWPILVKDEKGINKQIPAKTSLLVSLSAFQRGVHMSRLIEALYFFLKISLSVNSAQEFLEMIKKKTNSTSVFLEIKFLYFKNKKAPITGRNGFMNYRCQFSSYANNHRELTVFKIKVPVLSLCPCSLAISKMGAHNQRAVIELAVVPKKEDWFGEYIDLIEKTASSEVFSLLKRVDEKYVVEKAINKPCFVEDIVREIALVLRKKRYLSFLVKCKSYESIHNHNAFAQAGYNEEKMSFR